MMFLSPSIPVSLPLSLSSGILVQQFFSLVFGQVDRMHWHLCRFSGIYIECWTLKMVGKHISWLGLQLCCDFVIVLPVLTWQNMEHAGKRHLAGQDAFCAIIISTCKYFLSSTVKSVVRRLQKYTVQLLELPHLLYRHLQLFKMWTVDTGTVKK